MVAIKAHFDGKRIVMPKGAKKLPPGDVIVVFDGASGDEDREAWAKAQEQSFAKAWDNAEDAIYDTL